MRAGGQELPHIFSHEGRVQWDCGVSTQLCSEWVGSVNEV